MRIIKNGFYKLSEIKDNSIIIEDNLNVILFDEGNLNRKIEIMGNSRVEVYGFLSNIKKYEIEIKIIQEKSVLKVGYLLLSGNKEDLNIKMQSEIGASYSKIDKKIISIVGEKGLVNLDGILKINEGLQMVSGNLKEENLFLGETGKINCIPSLLVGSNNVEASHSCTIEKISDEKLFYLRSRGISKDNAFNMILESYVKTLFQCLRMIDLDFYNKIITKITTNLL